MYKTLSPSVLATMAEAGSTDITIKAGWESQGDWQAKPACINYSLGTYHESVFTCYYSRNGDALQITNVEATELIKNNKALVDAYLYLAIKELITMARLLDMKRLIVDSYIPAAADHMMDLEFSVTARGISAGARGCKILKGI